MIGSPLLLLDHLNLPIPVSYPLLLMSSGYDFSKKLSLTCNGHTFYMLSNDIAHICDYTKAQACITLYINMVQSPHPITKTDSRHNRFQASIDYRASILDVYVYVFICHLKTTILE